MHNLRKFFTRFGPGVITGASDDDPSGAIMYTQTGAQFGPQLIWTALFTSPLMMSVQEMSARLGLVSRQGLATLMKRRFARPVVMGVVLLLLIANVVNIGADLAAMAEVTRLLLPIPSALAVIGFAVIIVVLELTLSYARYVHILKWLTVTLFAYVAAVFFVNVDWSTVIRSLIPIWPSDMSVWPVLTGILGTTISPYLFFWQASEEMEEERLIHRVARRLRIRLPSRLHTMRLDTVVGMLFSNVIMFFIIVLAASTLHVNGVTTITSAADAAEALRPLAGPATFALFAFGIIGTGLLAVPVLAGSAAYAFAEVLNWPEGLGKTIRQAPGFYLSIIVAILIGVAITMSGIDPIRFLILSAVLNGLIAPIIIYFIIKLADDPQIVGQSRSPRVVRFFAWTAFILMTLAGIMTIITFIL